MPMVHDFFDIPIKEPNMPTFFSSEFVAFDIVRNWDEALVANGESFIELLRISIYVVRMSTALLLSPNCINENVLQATFDAICWSASLHWPWDLSN